MNSPSDDKAFDEYLGRRSPVSQTYRGLPSDEVPAHLDQQVLAQARAAAAGADELAQVRAKRRRLMQWTLPAAIAASALLVVSIVIRSGVEHEVTSADFPLAAKQAPQTSPAAPVTRPETAEASAEESVVMIAPPRDAVTEFSSYARSPAQNRSNAQDKRAMPQEQRPVIEPAQVAASVPAPAAPPPPQMAETEERTVVTAARREQEMQSAVAARRQEAAKESVRGIGGISESANAADAAPSVARLHEDPQDWLEHIRELRRTGQAAAADREWKQFQETYPDHPVAETDLARGKTDSR